MAKKEKMSPLAIAGLMAGAATKKMQPKPSAKEEAAEGEAPMPKKAKK